MKISYFYFAISFILFVAFHFFVPSLSSHPEMWAEATTNYFWNAKHLGLWENLWAVDSAYLPWFPRLVAVLVDRLGLNPVWNASVYQGISIFFISICSSTLCLPTFRVLIKSDTMRFLITLGLLIRFEYALHTFINFSYFGVIPFFLILVSYPYLDKFSWKKQFLLGSFFFMLGASKALFLCFLPTILVFFVLAIFLRHFRSNLGLILGAFAGLFIQYNSIYPLSALFSAPTKSDKLHLVGPILLHWVTCIFNTVSGQFLNMQNQPNWLWIFVCLGTIAFIFLLKHKFQKGLEIKFDFWLLAVTGLISGGACAVTVIAYPQLFGNPYPNFLPEPVSLFASRWWIIPVTVLYLGIMIFLFRNFYHRVAVKFTTFGLFLFSSAFWIPESLPSELPWPAVGYSDWRVFSPMIPKDKQTPYCVTGNPYPSITGKDCSYLIDPPSQNYYMEEYKEKLAEIYVVPDQVTRGKLMYFGLPKNIVQNSGRIINIVALDKNQQILAHATLLNAGQGPIQFFAFQDPVANIAQLKFEMQAENNFKKAELNLWIWMGIPEKK